MSSPDDAEPVSDDQKYAFLDSYEGVAPLPSAPDTLIARARRLAPGLVTTLVIALAASFLADHYGAPVMLFALLIGMAFHFLMEGGAARAGIQFAATGVLRFGVALLGARITIDQIAALGLPVLLVVIGGVVLTIIFGAGVARALGLSSENGVLTGGAVAICGASAALAISAVMPPSPTLERTTMLTVIGVTSLSTLAMILYPPLAVALGFSSVETGLFLGGTIHDVAQVVGAGYSVSTVTGDTATIVKLLRVAMLVPVVLILGAVFSTRAAVAPKRRPFPLPWFLVAFLAIVVFNSLHMAPPRAMEALSTISRWCLVTAIAALGVKTSFKSLAVVGWRPVALMVAETAFIATLIVAAIVWVL